MAERAAVLNELGAALAEVHARIACAAMRSGRSPDAVKLVAVSKTYPPETIRQAIALGVTDFGESRVQEAEPKIAELARESVLWHLVGHLQSNKARRAARLFGMIHSIDSGPLAVRLDRICEEEGRAELPVLVQVDLAGEAAKSGATAEELPSIIDAMRHCRRLSLRGFMTIPPLFENPEMSRPFFRRLRELRDTAASTGAFGGRPGDLSMGMTNDFEVAIQEGATIVRVGTAIFGSRQQV